MSSPASGMPSCAVCERLNRSREGKGANYYRFHCNDCYENTKSRFFSGPQNVLAEDAVLGEMQESMESSDLEGEQMARNQLKEEQTEQTWTSHTQQTVIKEEVNQENNLGNGDNNILTSQLSYSSVANDIKEEPVDEQENSLVTSWNSSAQLLSSEAVGTDAEVKDEEEMMLDNTYNTNGPYPLSCTLASEEDWQGIDHGNYYNTNTQFQFSSSTAGVEVEEEGGHDQTWMNRRSSRIAGKETLASSYMYNKYEQETAQNTCEYCRKTFSSIKWLAKHLKTHMPTYKQEQKVKKSAAGKVKKKRKQTKRERRERFRALAKRSLEVQGLGKGSRSKPFVPPYEEAMRLDDSYNINRPYPFSCTLASEEDWQGIDPGNYYNTNTQSQFSSSTVGVEVEEEGGHDQTLMNRRSSRIAGKETLASSYMYNKYEQETAQNTCELCRKMFSSTKWLAKHLKTHMPNYKQEQKVKKSAAGKVTKKRKQTKRERRERYRALAKRSQEVRGLGKGSRSKPFVPPVGYKVIRYEKSLVLMTPEKTRIRGAAAAADLLQERGFKKSLVLESSSSEDDETSPSADMEQASGNTASTTGQPGRKKRANKKDADWLEETERLRQLNKRKQNRKKGKKKTSWVCKCKEKFTSKTSYNQHRLQAHPLTCRYCEENFRSRQLLNKHLKTHMPSEDKLDLRGNKLFLCDHCGQFFTDKKLQWHKLKLNEVKMYKCVVNNCESTFRSRAAVQNHIATVHNRNRFPCPHEGCKQTFGEKSRLKSHYKVHTDERRYQCSYCGKMFRRSEHLRVHMRIHTGDNPFNCSLCNYSGRQYNSLRWHMKTHHPEHCENSDDIKDEKSKEKVLEKDINALADKDESDNASGSAEKRYSTRSRSNRAKWRSATRTGKISNKN
ncbi:uncharacterized protein LOC144879342 isoform X1 [Branchiostoma floridae x Branchiostoma japonicum]